MGRITKRSVEAIPLPAAGKRAYLWDDALKGFGVMVTPAGSRSYLVQYQMGGRGSPTQRATIGRHGAPWTADAARDRAAELLLMIRRGTNPVDQQRKQREASEDGRRDAERLAFDTYADLFATLYVDRHALRSADDIKSVLRRDLKPKFKRRAISTIRRGEIAALMDEIAERSPSAAVKAHKWLRKLFAWAVDRGDIGASPMDKMSPPAKDGERTRVLEGVELRAVWDASADLGEPYTSFVRILLLTGQRLREVAGMDWAELDLAAAEWTIPGVRTKNKRPHLVPLSPLAVSIIRARAGGSKVPKRGPVFTTDGERPLNGFSKPKAKLDKAISGALLKLKPDELPIMEPWVFHDLRRSFSTGCQKLGFPIEHTEAAINHASGKRGGLAGIYQRHDYKPEKVSLMAAWSRHVETITSGLNTNVVPLATARAG